MILYEFPDKEDIFREEDEYLDIHSEPEWKKIKKWWKYKKISDYLPSGTVRRPVKVMTPHTFDKSGKLPPMVCPNPSNYDEVNPSELVGKTIAFIQGLYYWSDVVIFTCTDGTVFYMFYNHELAKAFTRVHVGKTENESDLLGSPVISCSVDFEEDDRLCAKYGDTTFIFKTVKGEVKIEWRGEIDKYYNDEIDPLDVKFVRIKS